MHLVFSRLLGLAASIVPFDTDYCGKGSSETLDSLLEEALSPFPSSSLANKPPLEARKSLSQGQRGGNLLLNNNNLV